MPRMILVTHAYEITRELKNRKGYVFVAYLKPSCPLSQYLYPIVMSMQGRYSNIYFIAADCTQPGINIMFPYDLDNINNVIVVYREFQPVDYLDNPSRIELERRVVYYHQQYASPKIRSLYSADMNKMEELIDPHVKKVPLVARKTINGSVLLEFCDKLFDASYLVSDINSEVLKYMISLYVYHTKKRQQKIETLSEEQQQQQDHIIASTNPGLQELWEILHRISELLHELTINLEKMSTFDFKIVDYGYLKKCIDYCKSFEKTSLTLCKINESMGKLMTDNEITTHPPVVVQYRQVMEKVKFALYALMSMLAEHTNTEVCNVVHDNGDINDHLALYMSAM